MPKFKQRYPMNTNSVVLKPSDDSWDIDVKPKFNEQAIFVDEKVVGPLYDVVAKSKFSQKELSAFQLWEEVKKHGVSINPITKLPRIIGLLLKLEEMGLKGDLDAIKLYFDRVIGKQPENLTMNLTRLDTLSDGDLLQMALSDGAKKTPPSTQPIDVASESQEPDEI